MGKGKSSYTGGLRDYVFGVNVSWGQCSSGQCFLEAFVEQYRVGGLAWTAKQLP
jgi:hypothetical protein